MLLRSRRDPAEKERKRRSLISERGRLIEGVVTDFTEGVVYYTYSWRSVEYLASQDLTAVSGESPLSADAVIGLVTVKFLPADPSNSIVYAETWSGLPRLPLAPSGHWPRGTTEGVRP